MALEIRAFASEVLGMFLPSLAGSLRCTSRTKVGFVDSSHFSDSRFFRTVGFRLRMTVGSPGQSNGL
jgi:hypothetical protein